MMQELLGRASFVPVKEGGANVGCDWICPDCLRRNPPLDSLLFKLHPLGCSNCGTRVCYINSLNYFVIRIASNLSNISLCCRIQRAMCWASLHLSLTMWNWIFLFVIKEIMVSSLMGRLKRWCTWDILLNWMNITWVPLQSVLCLIWWNSVILLNQQIVLSLLVVLLTLCILTNPPHHAIRPSSRVAHVLVTRLFLHIQKKIPKW